MAFVCLGLEKCVSTVEGFCTALEGAEREGSEGVYEKSIHKKMVSLSLFSRLIWWILDRRNPPLGRAKKDKGGLDRACRYSSFFTPRAAAVLELPTT